MKDIGGEKRERKRGVETLIKRGLIEREIVRTDRYRDCNKEER